MTERSESTRQSDRQPQAGPDAPAPPTQDPPEQDSTPRNPSAEGSTDQGSPAQDPSAPSPKGGAAAPTTPTEPAEKPTVYRSGGALFTCVGIVVLCLLAIIDLLVELGTRDLLACAVLVLVASLAYSYAIYPAAFTTSQGLRIRNQLRTIDLPWSTVTDLTAKLSFVVHTKEKRYTVWAIPVSLHERRKAERARMKEITRADRESRRPVRGTTRISDIEIPTGRRSDPIDRLSYADQAIGEMNGRREENAQAARVAKAANPKGAFPEATVTARFTWPVPLAVGISVLLVVLAAVL